MTTARARHLIVLLALAALFGPGSSRASAQPSPALPALPALPVWMAGCWTGATGDQHFSERWTAPDDRTLVGVGYTVKGGRMTAFDYFRVIARDGRLVYVAQPGGQPPTDFTAASATATEVVFENPAHDYPKRVGYQRVDVTHLTAWIDGGPGGGPRVTFAMQHTRCDP